MILPAGHEQSLLHPVEDVLNPTPGDRRFNVAVVPLVTVPRFSLLRFAHIN
jgi:hypothetical protein